MIGVETHVLLRHYLEQGLSKTAIAERLGINRRTIARWIQAGELDRDLDQEVQYGPRSPAPSKLDRYKPIIQQRLKDYPELTAVRLLEEIRAAGYPGGYSQVRDYVRGCDPGHRWKRWCASRRRRANRRRSTSLASVCRGAYGTR